MDSHLNTIKYYRRRILILKDKLDKINPESQDSKPLLNFQYYLITQITRAEKKINAKNIDLSLLKKELRKKGNDKNKSKLLKTKIEKEKKTVSGYKYLLYLWRCFGDGLVFKYISKWNLKRFLYESNSFEIKQAAGNLGGKVGFNQEWILLKDAIAHNVPAILCDLTNVIRHGDLCLLGASDPFVFEVKSSNNRNKRVERQLEAIESIHNYLKEDEGAIAGVECMQRVEIHGKEKHHGEALNYALELSKNKPYARIDPEMGLSYIVLNVGKDKNHEEIFKGIKNPLVFMLNQAKTEQRWDNYYPFVLSFSDAVNLYKFIAGEVYVLVVIDGIELERMAADIGYKLQFSEVENEAVILTKFIKGSEEPFKVVVSDHFFRRLGMEFISLEWFFSNEKEILKEIESKSLKPQKNSINRFTKGPFK